MNDNDEHFTPPVAPYLPPSPSSPLVEPEAQETGTQEKIVWWLHFCNEDNGACRLYYPGCILHSCGGRTVEVIETGREGKDSQPFSEILDAKANPLQQAIDFAEWGWTIIANAHGGDWEKESKDWQEAAAKYRDDFHNKIRNLAPADNAQAVKPEDLDGKEANRTSTHVRQKYRKRPVVITAQQFVEGKPIPKGVCFGWRCGGDPHEPHVHTIHNNQRVDVVFGDWIVPEPDGEHYYPVKDDIFWRTYERAAPSVGRPTDEQSPPLLSEEVPSAVAPSVVEGVEEKQWTKKKVRHNTVDIYQGRRGLIAAGIDELAADNLINFHNASLGEPRGGVAEKENWGGKETDVNADHPPKQKWSPIESAPKDGTVIDLWVNGCRQTDCYWGKPDHSCGEAGEYCDSDWHSAEPGWVDSCFGEFLYVNDPTHWMELPDAPSGNAVLPHPVSESPVGSTATGVEDEKEQDRLDAAMDDIVKGHFGIKLRYEFIRSVIEHLLKSKSLSEPKELEEEKQ